MEDKNYGLIDLHLHLDGSLSIGSVRELAAMQGITLLESDGELKQKLQVSPDCRDLNEYLEKFSFPCSLLQRADAIAKSVENLASELKAQGLLYAEIRFAPQLHTELGLSQREVVAAAVEGLKQSGFQGNLILCCMRGDRNEKENLETVTVAAEFLGKGVCAVDLAGAEALFPTAGFEELFHYAKERMVPCTIHAGEADGPESIKDALKFGARRLGHGVRCMEDRELVARLAREGIPLELCPTSNINTSIFEDIRQYPLLQLMDAGVKVTVNTDNMTVSGVTLRSEWEKLMEAFPLTREQVKRLLENAAEAAFATEETKKWLRGEIARRV